MRWPWQNPDTEVTPKLTAYTEISATHHDDTEDDQL